MSEYLWLESQGLILVAGHDGKLYPLNHPGMSCIYFVSPVIEFKLSLESTLGTLARTCSYSRNWHAIIIVGLPPVNLGGT